MLIRDWLNTLKVDDHLTDKYEDVKINDRRRDKMS